MAALLDKAEPRRLLWRTRGPRKPRPAPWDFCLYVAGRTPRSEVTLSNLRKICTEHLPRGCRIEVVDVLRDPRRAREDQIVALPTLVRRSPGGTKRLVGTLTDLDQAMETLGISSKGQAPQGISLENP